MTKSLFALIVSTCLLSFAVRSAEPFELKANDRVVFIGDAIVERDIQYNYLETVLSVRFHGKNVTFRNLGWSGDTVWGESRAVFGTQKDGYNSLIKAINETKPTVVFLCYGMNESFAGPGGLAHFEEGYNALLDNVLNPKKDAEHAAPPAQAKNRRDPKDVPVGPPVVERTVPRVVMVSPIAFLNDEANAMSKNSKQNENIKLYTEAIKKIAEKRGALFIDMFARFGAGVENNHKVAAPPRFTSDGMHLNGFGYQVYGGGIEKALGLSGGVWRFADAYFGDYEPISVPPDKLKVADSQLEKLRGLIAAKNLQFFNKWRPQNETYLFLFRKHEQGRNAKEIPEFDPFIAAKEAEIEKLAAETAKGMGL